MPLAVLRILAVLTFVVTTPVATFASTVPQNQIDYMPPFERPIRIPERITLTHAEPPYAIAGERSSWRVPLTLCRDVGADQPLVLEILSHRNNKGMFGDLQTQDPTKPGHISVALENGTPLPATFRRAKRLADVRIDVPEKGLAKGSKIVVQIGDPKDPKRGAVAPKTRMFNKFFVLYTPGYDGSGAKPSLKKARRWSLPAQRQIVAACLMHILGGKTERLLAYVPSRTTPGEEITMLVRPVDGHYNLSHVAVRDVDVLLDDRKLPATVEPVKDSTCLNVKVKIPTAGVHRLKVVDRASGKSCRTNPTDCRAEDREYNIYWGMLHGHTEMSDGWARLDDYFRQMRDEGAIDFTASSDHDHLYETPDPYWEVICEKVKQWNDPGRFVVFLGYEWAKWRRNGDGDRNVYYLKDDQPLFRSDTGHYDNPPALFKALKGKQAIVIPHHPGSDGNHCDYEDHSPYHERFIELHQVRGCYECAAEDGNPLIAKADRPNGELVAKGFVQRALKMGWRAGFTANGDDHRGTAGTDKPSRIEKNGKVIWAGGMYVLAKERTRESIWDALWNRRVVATSGPRMIVDVELNGHPIGSQLKASDQPSLRKRRKIQVMFHGVAPVERIDVIRNNKVVHRTKEASFTWEDTEPLKDVLVSGAKHHPQPFCYYYIRAVQTDHQAVWSSPIWIDP